MSGSCGFLLLPCNTSPEINPRRCHDLIQSHGQNKTKMCSPLWKCCNWCCSADWQSRWVKLGQSENMLIQLILMTIREQFARDKTFSRLTNRDDNQCSVFTLSLQKLFSNFQAAIKTFDDCKRLRIFNDRINNVLQIWKRKKNTFKSAYHKQKQLISRPPLQMPLTSQTDAHENFSAWERRLNM